jgi:Membrane protein involved in colicin uptake
MLENTTDKIKNKTLTIREAFDIAGKDLTTPTGQPTAIARYIEEAGKSLDSPWFDIGTGEAGQDFLKKLNEVGTESAFTALTSVEQKVAGQATVNDLAPPPNIFSAEGKARKLNLEKASQARRIRKFKQVPAAKTAIPALIDGLDVIDDAETRAAVAFNLLVPLRPGEVHSIEIDDIDFETGKFKDTWQRANKIRNDIDLPEVPMAILQDAKKRAEAAGRTRLFDTNTTKMTKAVNAKGGIKDKFAPFSSAMGREIRGVSDLRKIIPSLMAGELKLGIEVSTIMGHSSYDEMIGSMKAMTANSYVSGLISEEGSASKQSLKAFHNLFANTLGLKTINELPAMLGVDASSLTADGSPRIPVIQPGDDVSKAKPTGQLTDDDLNLIEETREERRQNLRLQALQKQEQALEVEERVLQKEKDISAKREAVKKQTEQDREARKEARRIAKAEAKAQEDAKKAQEEFEKMYDDPKKVMNANIEDTKKKFGTFFSDMAKKFRLVPVAGTALTAAAIGEKAEAGDIEGAFMEGLYGFTPLGLIEPETPGSGELQPEGESFLDGFDATELPGREDVLGMAQGGMVKGDLDESGRYVPPDNWFWQEEDQTYRLPGGIEVAGPRPGDEVSYDIIRNIGEEIVSVPLRTGQIAKVNMLEYDILKRARVTEPLSSYEFGPGQPMGREEDYVDYRTALEPYYRSRGYAEGGPINIVPQFPQRKPKDRPPFEKVDSFIQGR